MCAVFPLAHPTNHSLQKKRTPPKRAGGRGSAGSSKTGSRPGTPSLDPASTSSTLRAAASKLEQGVNFYTVYLLYFFNPMRVMIEVWSCPLSCPQARDRLKVLPQSHLLRKDWKWNLVLRVLLRLERPHLSLRRANPPRAQGIHHSLSHKWK